MADDKQKFFQQICQFIPINELPAHVQNEVLNKANLIKVRKGGFAFKQGDRDEFSYYVVDGEIELHANNQLHATITSGTDRARNAMAQLQPRQFSARASKATTVLQIRRDYLDKLLILHQKEASGSDITNYDLATAEMEVSEVHADEEVDWMTRMLQSELFSRMPTANIHAMFALLEAVEYKVGDTVIKQGDPGQDYFIIQSGRCQVLRAPSAGGKDIKLAELNPGDCFGEEALITNTTRNATVAMLSDGVLMRLSKDNFIELVKKPTLQSVSLERAQKLVAEGAVWLDVRFKNECDQGAIKNSVHVPLNMLRMQTDKLDRNKQYVVYCDTGGRSSTAAFLLAERGFKACYLEGGIVNNPGAPVTAPAEAPKPAETPKPAAAPKPAPAAKATPASPPPKVQPAPAPPVPKPPAPAAPVERVEDLDPDVKASVLEAQLARSDMQIKDVEKRRQEAQGQSQQAIQAEVERKLREERAKIEIAKKEAEAEAARLRQREEEKLQHMKQEAEKRLQEEKKKLEEVYSRNAEEMEKLQRLKLETEEQMKRERERLEQESGEAKRQLNEAQKMKKQVEASKRAMEKEAEQRRKEQEEMERMIQQKAREKLDEERKKLADQFERNNEELQKAKQERAEADASRNAAREEAACIIAEYKARHEEARALEDERLKAERLKLEAEHKKIQATLREVERSRHEAESAKRAANEEVERLRARQRDGEITQSSTAQQSLRDEIDVAKARLDRANQEIAQAQHAQEKAEEAKKVTEVDLAQRQAVEEELRKQLQADLHGFKKELDEEEKKFATIASQMDHMRRIKRKADAAKLATREATDNLLSDVASQLERGGK